MTKLKLVDLLSESFDDKPKVDKHSVIEGVRNFGNLGQSLFKGANVMEVAQQLSKIAESAHTHILGEQDDWFDKVSVNKNMGFLKGSVKEFKKTATEAHALNQRLQGLYEDIGHVLNRYYEIDEHVMTEKLDPVGQEDGDIDNDGDTDSSDEYLANRRKAVGNAIKGEGASSQQVDELGPIGPMIQGVGKQVQKLGKGSPVYDKLRSMFSQKTDGMTGPEKADAIRQIGKLVGSKDAMNTVYDQGGLSQMEGVNRGPSTQKGTQFASQVKQIVESLEGKQLNEMPGGVIPSKMITRLVMNLLKKKRDSEEAPIAVPSQPEVKGEGQVDEAGVDPIKMGMDIMKSPEVQSGEVDPADIVKAAEIEKMKQVGESVDARLLRLAGITQEAIEANKPTKRLSDIKNNVVSGGAVGKIHKKW